MPIGITTDVCATFAGAVVGLFIGKKLPETLKTALNNILGIAAIFVCVMQVTNAIMQAHGFVFLPIVTMVVGGLVMIFFDYVMVGIPSVNIFGSPLGTVVC